MDCEDTMKCKPPIHIFEYGENHPYNGNFQGHGVISEFPEGHLCVCNEKVKENKDEESITGHLIKEI